MTESSTGETWVPDGGRNDADPPSGTGAPKRSGAGPEEASRPAPAGGAEPGARREPPKLVKRLRERREAYQQRGRAYRVAWVTAGVIVVVAGLVMVVFPGPALIVIPIGLAMLSLQFAWAERLLDSTLERGIDAKDLALRASRRQKIVGVAAIACAVAAAAAVALIYFV